MKKILLLSFFTSIVFAQIPTTNLSLWLRADAGVTTSGNVVTAWVDQSPNNITMTRFGSTILIPNTINGLPAIRFPNTGNYFNTSNAAVTNLTNITYFAVGKFANTASDMFYKDAQYGLYINSASTARFYTRNPGSNELIYTNAGLVNNNFIYSGR